MAVKEVLKVNKKSEPSGEPATTVEVITPQRAAKWVEHSNPYNRKTVDGLVESYARDMASGSWVFSNDAICFDVEGNILNGQHRLQACMLAGKPFKTLVIRNLPRSAQDNMDRGKPRSLPDVLKLHGYVHQTRLAATIRYLLQIKKWERSWHPRMSKPTSAEALAILAKHKGIIASVKATDGVPVRGISRALLAALHYVGTHLQKDPEKADAFLQVFSTGVPAYSHDPAHALREFMIRHEARQTSPRQTVRFFNGIRAWNAFRAGETREKWISSDKPIPVDNLNVDKI